MPVSRESRVNRRPDRQLLGALQLKAHDKPPIWNASVSPSPYGCFCDLGGWGVLFVGVLVTRALQ